MCSKCGRRFPHKQNCVYHLKRKHKIVCETIDQYVSNGLVLFKGSAGHPSHDPGMSPGRGSPTGQGQQTLKQGASPPPGAGLGSSPGHPGHHVVLAGQPGGH